MQILLGVSGSIAAYRACELVSLAKKRGHAVRVTMTRGAAQLVGPATFEALSGEKVLLDTFAGASGTMDHIAWAKWAEVAVVAPMSANTLGKLACGLADDALSTTWMAIPRGVPIVVAPAMNTEMWFHPAVQRNLGWLKELGRYAIVDPVEKRLACGDLGVGGMAEPVEILGAIEAAGQGRPGGR